MAIVGWIRLGSSSCLAETYEFIVLIYSVSAHITLFKNCTDEIPLLSQKTPAMTLLAEVCILNLSPFILPTVLI